MYQSTISYAARQCIRDKIEPFGGWSPDKQPFGVGWCPDLLTFPQIMADLKAGIEQDLRYFRKLESHHLPDLLQQGWLRLWQALHENKHLLAHMTCHDAVDFVANRCGVSTYKHYLKRYSSYHDFDAWNAEDAHVYEDNITEIVIGSSLKSSGKPGHALFTRVVDRLIDITQAIREVAQWCGDDLKKLVALYYLTTNVTQVDAGRIAGLPVHQYANRNPRCNAMMYWSKLVLARLKEALKDYMPFEPNRNFWKDCIKAGDVQPIIELAEKYSNQTERLLALYSLTTRVARDTLVKELGVSESKLWYALEQVRQELRAIYASRMRRKG